MKVQFPVLLALAASLLPGAPALAQDYEYDVLGRLRRVVQPTSLVTTYTLDLAGNRLQRATGSGGPPPAPAAYAQNDSASVMANATSYIDVLFNDSGAGLAVVSVSGVTGGYAAVGSGGGSVVYSAPGTAGSYSFVYTIQDSLGRTSMATAYVEVFEQPSDPCDWSGDVACEITP